MRKDRIFVQLKVFPPRLTGKNSRVTVEKISRHHQNQVIKVDITGNKAHQHHVSSATMH